MTSAELPQRLDRDAFEALRDQAAADLDVDPRLVEKDYWATQVLRVATAPTDGGLSVFKGGTSLSKAFRIIERFSEDVDLLLVTGDMGNALKRRLRAVADRVTDELGLKQTREVEGRGFLNARFAYTVDQQTAFLTRGVLLEIGSRGGPDPNEQRDIMSLMGDAAERAEPGSSADYSDLAPFTVTALSPERTLAEKLAFLHHRSSIDDEDMLRRHARHLYDVAMLLRHDETLTALHPGRMAELMVDVDGRSEAAGWGFTPRPRGGFADSPAFTGAGPADAALRAGYASISDLVWGQMPTYDEAIEIIKSQAVRI